MDWWDALITDRTIADVTRIQQLNQKGWAAMSEAERVFWRCGIMIPLSASDGPLVATDGPIECGSEAVKGAYNAVDLNRVGHACNYVKNRFDTLGYEVIGWTEPKLDWKREDIPTTAQMQAYLANVEALRVVLDVAGDVPESMSGLDYAEANEIERVLIAVDAYITGMVYSVHRSAENQFYSGVSFVPTANTDYGRTWEELDVMNTEWANWNAATWYLLLYGDLKEEA